MYLVHGILPSFDAPGTSDIVLVLMYIVHGTLSCIEVPGTWDIVLFWYTWYTDRTLSCFDSAAVTICALTLVLWGGKNVMFGWNKNGWWWWWWWRCVCVCVCVCVCYFFVMITVFKVVASVTNKNRQANWKPMILVLVTTVNFYWAGTELGGVGVGG